MPRSLLYIGLVAGLLASPALLDAQEYRRVDDTKTMRLRGSSDRGELVFAAVNGATRLTDGTIVVGDAIASSIHFFDAAGGHRGSFGREGDGPGEFRHITWIGACGAGEVHVWDLAGSRLTVLDGDRRLLRQFALPSDPGSDLEPLSVRCSSRGSFAFIAPAPDSVRTLRDGARSYLFDLAIADASGRVTGRLPRVLRREFVRVRSAQVPMPLSAAGTFAIGEERLVASGRADDEIAVYSLDGRPITTIRLELERRRATRRHLEAASEKIAGIVAPTLRERTHDQLLQLPLPQHLPSFDELFLAPDDVLWVVVSAAGDPRTRLLAYSKDGRALGHVNLPTAVTIYEIGADYILGSVEDALGEQTVVVYRLRDD